MLTEKLYNATLLDKDVSLAFTIMEYEAGAPYYEAKVVSNPVRRIDGTVIAKVEFCETQKRTIASFYSGQQKAMELKVGALVHVCPYDGDAYID